MKLKNQVQRRLYIYMHSEFFKKCLKLQNKIYQCRNTYINVLKVQIGRIKNNSLLLYLPSLGIDFFRYHQSGFNFCQL